MSDQYQLLDSGNLRKLEQAGPYRLVRSCANAFWKPSLPQEEWDAVQGSHSRDSRGGGEWTWCPKPSRAKGGFATKQGAGKKEGDPRIVPESWITKWGGLNLVTQPTAFGHLGFFAEQYKNWDWLRATLRGFPKASRVLNVFAYSGGSSLAMAEAGAVVTHVDAAKGMINWGQENLKANPHIPETIRWIVDDAVKFAKRELRRGNTYHGIVLDPPSFGRGAQGQIWKIEEHLIEYLDMCKELLVKNEPRFVLLSCHSEGFTPIVLARLLSDHFSVDDTQIEQGEMTIPEKSGRLTPAGTFARFSQA